MSAYFVKCVVFDVEDTRMQEHVLQLCQHLKREGVEVRMDDLLQTVESEGSIWVSDNAMHVRKLCGQQKPVVAYLHCGNRDSDFAGVLYAAEQLEELSADYFDKVYRRYKKIPWEILETSRCLVRETVPEDAEAFARIYSDPEITRYTDGFCQQIECLRKEDCLDENAGSKVGLDKDDWNEERRTRLAYDSAPEREYIKKYIEKIYEFYGYGIWTVILKATGEVIGRVGFQNFAEQSDAKGFPQLGYMIATEYQRQGLAQEICTAVLGYATEELFFEGVQVVIHEENQASLRLAQKLGFQNAGSVMKEGGRFSIGVYQR